MKDTQATHWWRHSAAAEGMSILDQHVSDSDDWRSAETTGAIDFARAVDASGVPVGFDLKVLEIGCGAGRMVVLPDGQRREGN